jgi:hypothetical protein
MSSVRKICGVSILFLVLVALPLHETHAQTDLVLQPDGATGKDSAITTTNPDSNYGSSSEFIQNWAGTDHGVIEFDLSAIPPGVTINSATLEVMENTNCSFNENAIEANLNLAAWDEATVTWNNAPGYGPSLGTNSGETGGCDWLVFDVTGPVQDWVDGTSTNYGFRLTGPGAGDVIKFVNASEWGTAADRPILRINYALAGVNIPTVTEWGIILLSALIALSAVTILWRRNRAAA